MALCIEGKFKVVDPVSGRAYPVPVQRPPRPDAREPYGRDPYGREPYGRDPYGRDPYERDTHAPRHLADSWEGPVSINRPLPSRRHGLQWLLALPMIPPLLVPLYNRMDPKLFGLPFFYWFQLACVLFTIFMVTLVYQLTKGRRPRWPR
jgi:Protein of unknown function (DUF3311)